MVRLDAARGAAAHGAAGARMGPGRTRRISGQPDVQPATLRLPVHVSCKVETAVHIDPGSDRDGARGPRGGPTAPPPRSTRLF